MKPMTRYRRRPRRGEHPLKPPGSTPTRCPWRRWSSASRCTVRRRCRTSPASGSAVESGQHFLRLLAAAGDDRRLRGRDPRRLRRAAARRRRSAPRLDPETVAYADLVAGRALDGRRLRAALGEPGQPRPRSRPRDPPRRRGRGRPRRIGPGVAWADDAVQRAGRGTADQTWQPDRHGVHVLGRDAARRRRSASGR